MRKTSLISAMIFLMAIVNFIGCSSDKGGGDPISGTAAVGSPLKGTVTIKGSTGKTVQGKSDANGKFSIDITGLTAPFLIMAQDDLGLSTVFSVCEEPGHANVSPVTSAIVAMMGIDLDQLKTAMGTSAKIEVDASKIEDAKTKMMDVLIGVMANDPALKGALEGFDPLGGEFSADGSGFDRVLDLVKIDTSTIAGGTLGLTVAGETVSVNPDTFTPADVADLQTKLEEINNDVTKPTLTAIEIADSAEGAAKPHTITISGTENIGMNKIELTCIVVPYDSEGVEGDEAGENIEPIPDMGKRGVDDYENATLEIITIVSDAIVQTGTNFSVNFNCDLSAYISDGDIIVEEVKLVDLKGNNKKYIVETVSADPDELGYYYTMEGEAKTFTSIHVASVSIYPEGDGEGPMPSEQEPIMNFIPSDNSSGISEIVFTLNPTKCEGVTGVTATVGGETVPLMANQANPYMFGISSVMCDLPTGTHTITSIEIELATSENIVYNYVAPDSYTYMADGVEKTSVALIDELTVNTVYEPVTSAGNVGPDTFAVTLQKTLCTGATNVSVTYEDQKGLDVTKAVPVIDVNSISTALFNTADLVDSDGSSLPDGLYTVKTVEIQNTAYEYTFDNTVYTYNGGTLNCSLAQQPFFISVGGTPPPSSPIEATLDGSGNLSIVVAMMPPIVTSCTVDIYSDQGSGVVLDDYALTYNSGNGNWEGLITGFEVTYNTTSGYIDKINGSDGTNSMEFYADTASGNYFMGGADQGMPITFFSKP